MVAKNVDVDEENQVNTGWLLNNGPPWQIWSSFYYCLYMYKHCTNVHKEKESFPLIDFDFYLKSAEKLKIMPIELNKFISGGPLFSNHPVHTHYELRHSI